MQTIVATIVFFAVVMAVMAIGVIFSNRALRGSCGGTGEGCACSDEQRRACAEGKEQEGPA